MMLPKCVIIDIDGTLANVDHRRKWVDPKLNEEYEKRWFYSEGGIHYFWENKKTRELFKPDWKRFNEEMVNDVPNSWCTQLIWSLIDYDIEVLYVSGREEKFRRITSIQISEWIDKSISPYEQSQITPFYDDILFMRPTGDYRPDTEIKREIYEKHIKDKYEVLFCLDDRPSVCRLWRELGLICLQVDDKEF